MTTGSIEEQTRVVCETIKETLADGGLRSWRRGQGDGMAARAR